MAGISLACDIPLSVELKTRDVPGHLSSSGVVPWALGPKLGPAGTQRYHCGTAGWVTFRSLFAKPGLLGHQD